MKSQKSSCEQLKFKEASHLINQIQARLTKKTKPKSDKPAQNLPKNEKSMKTNRKLNVA